MSTRMGLYELLAPQFLAGFTFPAHIDRYLSVLGVDELRTTYDDTGVIYAGRCSFVGGAGAEPVREHHDPSGAVLKWEDVTIDFRLTLPRDGAAFISTAIGAVAGLSVVPAPVRTAVASLGTLFDSFGAVEETATTATDYPGVRMRLELMLNTLTFHLPLKSWVPGIIGPDFRPIPKPPATPSAGPEDVKFLLPKIVFVYEQGDDLSVPPSFRIDSWGNSGFDAPADLLEGELVRMDPPIALHTSGQWAFGVDQLLVDLSPDHTPPELLQFFGADEAFQGIYVKSARIYYEDKHKDLAINVSVNDLLISFAGEVSLEARVDFLGPETTLRGAIRMYENGAEVKYTKGKADPGTPTLIEGGRGSLLNTGVILVDISGGVPPLTASVMLDGTEIWNSTSRQAPISPGAPGTLKAPGEYLLRVSLGDAGTGAAHQTYVEEVLLTVRAATTITPGATNGAPADSPPGAAVKTAHMDPPTTAPSPAPAGYGLRHIPSPSGIREQISVQGAGSATALVGGVAHPIIDGKLSIDVQPGQNITVEVSFPAVGTDRHEEFDLYFELDRPDPTATDDLFNGQIRPQYVSGSESPHDWRFDTSTAPGGGNGLMGPPALTDWVQNRALSGADQDITIDGYASFERAENLSRDQRLSERRLAIARDIITAARPSVVFGHAIAHGHFDDSGAPASPANDDTDRVVKVRARVARPAPGVVLNTVIHRAANSFIPPPPHDSSSTTTPQPAPNKPPGIFRRISFRIRIERNALVLGEISGELDFETDMEAKLRATPTLSPTASLDLTNSPTNTNPKDGVCDFLLGFAYDTATHTLSETIAFGAAPDDTNGLFQMQNRHVGGTLTTENHFKDAFGALLILAPVINSAAGALDPKSAGDWAKLVVSVALPATIGGLGLLQTEVVTFYGGELRFRQYIPPGEALTFTNAAVLFDYSVDFGLAIPQLGVQWKKLSRVRYKAIGFSLNFAGTPVYQPVFDTSKGYELNLEDTGLLKLPSPLDEILKILAVRMARFNPLTLEVDLGMKVDLGVVKVDKFRVKWPLDDPPGVPMILPTSARIEIPGTLIGSGSINIVEPPHDPPPDAVTGGGFDGSLDVSLVAIKLRIAASLGVRDLNDPAHNRRATAVFAGLIVDFPAPLPLGQSGLGLFGLSGLFAMHYKRLEPAPVPGDSIGPALHWLVNPAEGEPAKLINSSGAVAWGPELDKWSFGVGAVLGTMDGFLVQLRGMFVLELPGPRILIFVKIQIVSKLEGLKPAAKLIVGILGVIDFDFNLGRITVGVLIDFEIKDILTIQIPIELFFNLHDTSDWHFHIGTFSARVTARILNLVNAYGYFMVSGKTIKDWPGRGPTRRDLPGLAVATGLAASITIGSTSIGLYLRVAAGLDMAVAFSPYFMVGEMYIDGELRIFIISIEAHGRVHVEAPNPTYVEGEICGEVDFFFFSVSGCVALTIGSNVRALPAPALVQNVFLQSHAPVITAGQGGDRPIDASLGDAATSASPGPSDVQIPVVPIDSVPVVQMHASPNVAGATCFAGPLVTPPFPTPDYFIDVGGNRKVKYVLKEISLTPPLSTAAGTPPATWRPDASSTSGGGVKTDVDLALMSRVPITGERAIERSSELDELVTVRWENLCKPVAPAVCILWTFCGQPLGPSGHGWILTGLPQPDPPGTTRTAPPPTTLVVEESAASGRDALLEIPLGASGSGRAIRAKVIGPDDSATIGGGEDPLSPLSCLGLSHLPVGSTANPRHVGGATLEARGPGGVPLNTSTVKQAASFTGLDAGSRTIVTLSAPSRIVDVRLVSFARQARVTAFNSNGSTSVAVMTAPSMTPDLLHLTGPGIVRLVIDAPGNETLILDICTEEQPKFRAPPVPFVLAKTGNARHDRLALAFNLRRYRRAHDAYEAALRAPVIAPSALDPIPLGRIGNGPLAASGRPGASVKAKGKKACYRALQLPERLLQQHGGDIKPNKQGLAVDAKRPSREWITLDTGKAKRVRLYVALSKVLFAKGGLRVRQLGAANAVLREDEIESFPTAFVTGVTTGLPAAWTDPSGPWAGEITPVATFLAGAEFSSLVRGVVVIKPMPDCLKIQLVIPKSAPIHEVPAALLSVVEVCPKSEAERVATATSAQSGDRDTLISYLGGSANVPLLQPGTSYHLRIRYDAVSRAANGTESTEANQAQDYYFKTENQAPKRLDPWVLATTPNDEERFVFYQDPLKVVFNDTAIVQLYATYGKSLRATLRAADGVVIPAHEVTSLAATPADLVAPYREFLEGMVASGALPCTGSIASPSHGTAVLPMPLRPLMAYTLDLEVDPPDAPPAPGKPITPLFRRSFTTGRYATVQALTDDFRGRSIRHRVLSSQLAGLPTGSVAIATDQEIQSALLAAGEQALPAPEIGGVTVYWAKRTGASAYSPHAILIDAAEAVWRSRSSPKIEVVPGQVLGQDDPSYARVVPGKETSMEMIESGSLPSAAISRFVHSPSGTRTLAIISNTFAPGAGAQIELHLHRPPSALYGLAAENAKFLTIPLGSTAPWEEDV